MLFFFEHYGMERKELFDVKRLIGNSFPAHLHRAYEIIYVREGNVVLNVDKKHYHMSEGDLAFIFCNQIHGFQVQENARMDVVIFSPEIIGSFYSVYREYVPENNIIHPQYQLDFHQCESIYARKSLLYSLCDELLKSTRMTAVSNNPQTEVIFKVFAYVDKHYGEECSLKMIAQAVQYDYAYLSKLFTSMTGMRFTEYLNSYRISQACYLLSKQELPVADIAAACGYANMRTFHRNFQMMMNCSPRAYKAGMGFRT